MLQLHIGCGTRRMNGFINIDAVSSPAVDVQCNALRLPDLYAPESVDKIFTSHMLEHLDRIEGLRFLNNCYVMLREGGELVVEFPALDLIAQEYQAGRIRTEVFVNCLYGLQRTNYDYHRFGYTTGQMDAILRGLGFDLAEVKFGHRTGYEKSLTSAHFRAVKKGVKAC